jgi:hypothetical protein
MGPPSAMRRIDNHQKSDYLVHTPMPAGHGRKGAIAMVGDDVGVVRNFLTQVSHMGCMRSCALVCSIIGTEEAQRS